MLALGINIYDRRSEGQNMYKILIVEDDLPMAQAIQKEMTMWGAVCAGLPERPHNFHGI